MTEATATIARSPFVELDMTSPEQKLMKKFVITMYDKSSAAAYFNEARRELFSKKKCAFDRLPPTEDALLQRIRRSIYQASIRSMSYVAQPDVPSPKDF